MKSQNECIDIMIKHEMQRFKFIIGKKYIRNALKSAFNSGVAYTFMVNNEKEKVDKK